MLRLYRFPLAILLLTITWAVAAPVAVAQTGALSGRVRDRVTNAPLAGATIRIVARESSSRVSGAVSGANGRFVIRGLKPGVYQLTVTYLGYAQFEQENVDVRAGTMPDLDVLLDARAIGSDEVVVSASRRPEKVTSAPASVSVVDARRVDERPALTAVDHLKNIAGLDIVQSGLTQSNVVARGFNNAFSGTLMMLTDNRIAGVPSLRLNAHNFVPLVNEDIQQIEVIRGPGAALYGPNAANGVLHIITRSPFASAGTWFSVAGGERDVVQLMGRHAGTLGDHLGYKLSLQYMRGDDWGYVDSAEVAARTEFLADTLHRGVNPDTLKIGLRDSLIERVAGEFRLDYAPLEDLTAILAVGWNDAIRNPDITGVGGAQARDWLYTYLQARVNYKDLFVQAFLNQSDAGKSYLLRSGQPVVDRSRLIVAQAQHSASIENTARLTYGVDFLRTIPVTDSTITGGNEDDDDITELGGYLQADAPIVDSLLQLVVAGRVDYHSRLADPIFSPRAALVYTPSAHHTIRATYNTAYSSPSTNDMFMDIVVQNVAGLFDVRASGIPEDGFRYERGTDGHALMHGIPAFGYPATSTTIGDVAPAWSFLQGLIRQSGLTLLDSVPPPPSSVAELRTLDASTGTFDSSGEPADRPGIRPTITNTLEIGYKGVVANRLGIALDVYRSQYHDFIGPLQSITPNVFFNRNALRAYLIDRLRAQGSVPDSAQLVELATILADTASKIPFGVLSPIGATDPSAVLFASRNYGDITVYGLDLGLQFGVVDGLILSGTLSYVDKNFFANLDNVSDLALNAPKLKYTLGAEFHDPGLGLNAEVRFRHVDGFPVNSGVYIGQVPGYSVVDINVGCRVPFVEGITAGLSVQNLLTWVEGGSGDAFSQRHAEFVGTPALGRLALARITYELH